MPTYNPPGTRGNNEYFVARGYIHGRQREIATDTTNERDARKAWNRFKKEEEQRPQPRSGTLQTFREVADLWLVARNASNNAHRYVKRLMAVRLPKGRMENVKTLGKMPIRAVKRMDIEAAASKVYRGCTNATKNRQAYAPASAILRWAADNELRDWIVIRLLPDTGKLNRTTAEGVRDLLLDNTTGKKHLIIALWFFQGWRITESLGLDARDGVNLPGNELALFIKKAGKWKVMPMHPAIKEAILNTDMPEKGRVFPWGDRHNVYRWLDPQCEELGITFTPHMARHDYGTAIRDSSDLVAVGSWTSEQSTRRYVTTDETRAKAVMMKLPPRQKIRGRIKGKDVKG